MAVLGRLLKLIGRGADEAEHLAQQAARAEPALDSAAHKAGDVAEAGAKKKLSPEETKRYLAEQPVKKARREGVGAVTEKLTDLTPGRFGRDQLDARLKALTDTAKEHKLIDSGIERKGKDFAPKQAEEALMRGEPITPKEMASLQARKHEDFNRFESSKTREFAENERRAKGERTMGDRVKSGLTTAAIATAGVIGVGGLASVAAEKVGDWYPDSLVGNMANKIRSGAAGASALANKEKLSREAQNCAVNGGAIGEVTGSCLTVNFTGGYASLREVFFEGLTRESDRVLLKKLGEGLAVVDAKNPKLADFQREANELHKQVVQEVSKKYTGENAPNVAFVDAKLRQALGWDGPGN